MDVASGSTLTINQTISAYPLVKNGLGTLVFNASIIIPAGPPFASLNLNAGTLLNGAPAALSTQTGSVMQFDAPAGPTLFYSSPLIFGGGSLTKTGAGVYSIGGTVQYSGNTTVTAGTLQFGDGGAGVQTTSAVNISAGATLELANVTLAQIGFLSGTGSLTLTSGTLTTGANGITTTYSGNITGGGSLIKTGTGTWRLSAGSNTYTGGTTINGGTLSIGSDLRLGNSSGVLTFAGGTLNTSASFTSLRGIHLSTGGGTFDVNNATTLTLSGGVTGTTALTKTGAGSLVLGGTNTYTGGTVINAGSVSISADNNLGSSTAASLTLAGGTLTTTTGFSTPRFIVLNSTGGTVNTTATTSTVTHSGVISGTAPLTKAGAGFLTLGGASANTMTGLTTVAAGTLNLAKPNNVNAVGGNLTVNSGSILQWQADEQIPDSATLTLNSSGTPNLNDHTETVGSFVDNGGTTIPRGGHLFSSSDLSLVDASNITSDVSVARDVLYV